MNFYEAVSPLDYRYYGGDKKLFEKLRAFVSEEAFMKYELKVEVALVKVMSRYPSIKKPICLPEVAREVEEASHYVTYEEVYLEEKKTHHNIRALVNCLKRRVSVKAKPFVHLFATSSDIMDTATALRLKDLSREIILPDLIKLEELLIKIAREGADVVQIGRTHGQHAEPITFGFAMAEYVNRLGNRIKSIKEASENLRGKLSGAVGAYNALSLVNDNFSPEIFEKMILKDLGLKPSLHSTQIVEPEYLGDLVYSVISCFSVLANLSDDIRHLERTEIGEIVEEKGWERIGSSTMPHKVNPWNFEHIKSMWKAFMPRIITVLMDQISEHQRDLTNSASSRFLMEIFTAFIHCVERLNAALGKIEINRERMGKNLNFSKEFIVAEPLYILLSINGHPDGYGCVRKLLAKSRKEKKSLRELIGEDEEVKLFLAKINERQRKVLNNPEEYIGISREKTENICEFWESSLENIKSHKIVL